ncbi:hypothetical protein [Ligilactobacillus apodemi]|uniref:hypothetical protein n=1 Tax=Ligilactobacillus apodemi TaxID=307126 RepID=UPI00214ACA00|nr:hypothetical protein [Ligilactobacillus apodemi]MCR1900857.1 hypothetical protein [Ligilactobacillus apodemi]
MNKRNISHEYQNIRSYLNELKNYELNGKSATNTVERLETEIQELISKIANNDPTFREQFDRLDKE